MASSPGDSGKQTGGKWLASLKKGNKSSMYYNFESPFRADFNLSSPGKMPSLPPLVSILLP